MLASWFVVEDSMSNSQHGISKSKEMRCGCFFDSLVGWLFRVGYWIFNLMLLIFALLRCSHASEQDSYQLVRFR